MMEVTVYARNGKAFRRMELGARKPLHIGRSGSCEIHVPFEDVSRHHAVLIPLTDELWELRDLESTHGCVLGKERVRTIRVHAGLEVRIASATLKFTDVAERIAVEINTELGDDAAEATVDLAESLQETLPTRGRAPEMVVEVSTRSELHARAMFFWRGSSMSSSRTKVA